LSIRRNDNSTGTSIAGQKRRERRAWWPSVNAGRQAQAMSLEQLANLAQIIGSAGVVLSLIFVGLQLRQNTRAIQRNEHNATMAQWTVIRMASPGTAIKPST
jgi:hypothetical protein